MNRDDAQCRVHAALRGALGLTVPTMIVYGSVAWGERWLYSRFTVLGTYALWTAVFLVLAPWLMARLLVERPRRPRFTWAFILGFLAYAIAWVAAYFALRGRVGEVVASVVGPGAMGIVLAGGMRAWSRWGGAALVLTMAHGVGYALGSWANGAWGGTWGMLAWGVAYGLGFGAGIGWVAAGFPGAREPGAEGLRDLAAATKAGDRE